MEKAAVKNGVLNHIDSFIEQSFVNRFWDWRASLLAIGLIQLASARLAVTEWAPFLYFSQTLAFWGTILGLLLGYSSFKRPAVIRIVNGYTLIVLPWLWLRAINRTDRLMVDLVTLAERLFTSLGQFLKNQPVEDTLFFVVIASAGFWVIGLWAGYQLTRHKDFLDVVLPSGLVMITVQIFDPQKTTLVWAVALYIFGALILLGRLYFIENQANWQKSRVHISPEAIKDVTNSVLITAFIAVTIAWSMPGLLSNVKSAAQTWTRVTRSTFDRLSNATKSLNSEYTTNLGGDFYGTEIALGQKATTDDSPAFSVQLRNSDFIPLRIYWRGRVFDQYKNGQWTSSPTDSENFSPANDDVQINKTDRAREARLLFTYQFNKQSLMYAPSETTWVSRPSTLSTFTDSGSVPDVTAWVAEPALSKGDSYEVHAWIVDPTIKELRAAGTEYPGWITDRYLQVPDSIAPQLRVLAEQITASQDTVYDKTSAITAYLRHEIAYTTQLDHAPPNNTDPVLWVLFDYKKGFCMYYASAEVLMLRSIGIPARFAVGFAEGSFDDLQKKYTVTYANSHAWPEVYFPGIGWVEFEPTGNQTPLDRPETSANAGNDGSGFVPNSQIQLRPEDTLPDNSPQKFQPIATGSAYKVTKNYLAWYILAALLMTGIAFTVFYLRRNPIREALPVYLANRFMRAGANPPAWLESWIRWGNLTAIEKSFQAVNFSLYWLGHSQPASMTSSERAEILIKYLPDAEADIMELLREYQATIYTPKSGNAILARRLAYGILIKTWKKRLRKSQ